jgi:lipase chaperone LimK
LFARPGNNQAQNKQFKGAVQQLERELGRKLSADEVRRLHDAIHDLEDPGFQDIVDQGHKEFDKPGDEGNGD